MNRIHLVLLTLGLCGLVAAAARADLFEDDFEGATGPLDAGKWTVRTDGKVTVGQAGGWASFNFAGDAGNNDTARAWTQNTWRIDTDGPLTWQIDFQMAAGTRSTTLVPFVFDTDWDDEAAADNKYYKDTDVNVAVHYMDSSAVANINLFHVAWVSFKDSEDNLFGPAPGDTTIYTLVMTLNDTDAMGAIRERDDLSATVYTAQVAHDLTLSVPGHLGMQVHNNNGADAKTICYDNAHLIPSPVSVCLAAQGLLAVGGLEFLRRRRRAGSGAG
jgi:hypothetical protein